MEKIIRRSVLYAGFDPIRDPCYIYAKYYHQCKFTPKLKNQSRNQKFFLGEVVPAIKKYCHFPKHIYRVLYVLASFDLFAGALSPRGKFIFSAEKNEEFYVALTEHLKTANYDVVQDQVNVMTRFRICEGGKLLLTVNFN